MTLTIYNSQGAIESIDEPTAITIGMFDGVHRGHQALLRNLCDIAQRHNAAPTVVTLTAHPSFVLGRHANEYWLDDPDEHLQLLLEAGAKYIVVLPFTADPARLTACDMARMMHRTLHMRHLLAGYDSRFGSRQHDDFNRLPSLAQQIGFTYQRGTPFLLADQPISSSRIRQTLIDGDIGQTNLLLGRHYTLDGPITHGRGIGHTLGFPTANIDLTHTRKMQPREGVYAVSIGTTAGVANLGPIPTYGIHQRALEVHLINFDGDLYGQHATVAFHQRLRDIQHFDTPQQLQQQIAIDIQQALACHTPTTPHTDSPHPNMTQP